MVWLHRSPIPVGRRGEISSFKLFLPAFPHLEEGGWGSAPCGPGKETNQRIEVYTSTQAWHFQFPKIVLISCKSQKQVSYNIWNKILFINCAIVNCTFLEDNPVPFARPLSSPFWPFLSSVRPPLSSIGIPLSSSPLLVGLTPVILALCVALIKYGYYEHKVEYGTIQKECRTVDIF